MGIRRAVPDHTSDDLRRSRAFYVEYLGFEVGRDGMDCQLRRARQPIRAGIVMTQDQTANVSPDLTIQLMTSIRCTLTT